MDRGPDRPDWNRLYEVAAGQEGLFTTEQALGAGYSPQLLVHYVRSGRSRRLRRGIYRLVHFPAGEHEVLVELWLWSEQQGVLSHQTALALHELSDVMTARVHLTLPGAWRARRLRVPRDVVLHHADVPAAERSWIGAVPITSPARTLRDCAAGHLAPDLLRQALDQAPARGLVARRDVHDVEEALVAADGATP